jgi:hypothetical protein
MVNEQSSRGVVAVRWVKRPLVLFVIAAALLAMLAVAERQSAPPLNANDIASRQSALQRFSGLFGSPAAGPASAAQLRSSSALTPVNAAQAPVTAGVSTPEQALSAAQNAANTAVNTTSQAAGAAVAAQEFPPFVSAIVCPILLQARATVVATINALIAAFPFLAPQLNAVLASALATIDAQLAQFGCVVSPAPIDNGDNHNGDNGNGDNGNGFPFPFPFPFS